MCKLVAAFICILLCVHYYTKSTYDPSRIVFWDEACGQGYTTDPRESNIHELMATTTSSSRCPKFSGIHGMYYINMNTNEFYKIYKSVRSSRDPRAERIRKKYGAP